MTKESLLRIFEISDILYLPDAITKLLEGDIETRDKVYFELLELNNYDVSYDWFQNIYEEEFAQRKQSKQDFTPNSVGLLASYITGVGTGTIHEPTAGNGGMLIANWWHRCLFFSPVFHYPSQHMIDCWELSDRAIPILLLNLSIRGMMGYVTHGDVLEQKIKNRYLLLNRNDDTLAFSEIIKDETLKTKIITYEIGRSI